MRITMANMDALRDAAERFVDAWSGVDDDLATWTELDGATDRESREQRADARESLETGIDDLEAIVVELAELLGSKR